MQIIGRIIRLKQFKNACFFTVLAYDHQTKLFKQIKLVLESEKFKDLEQYRKAFSNVFLGSVVKIVEYDLRTDKENNLLYTVRDLISYNHPTKEPLSPYPNRFKLNELKNKDTVYKERLYALTVNPELVGFLAKKYLILETLRNLFIKENFIATTIPVLQTYTGGAEAEPFQTHCNYNKKNYALRTCFEFPLKGLLIAGFPRVFHIGSAFRNQSLDKTHSPEFLYCEAYAIDTSLDYFKNFTEKIYAEAYYSVHKTYKKYEFDLSKPWPVYQKEYLETLIRLNHVTDLDALIDLEVLGPFFHVKGYPSILAKHESARIESYVDYTVELAHFYEEENSCDALGKKSRTSQVPVAPEFLNMLSYGMPEATGWGIGLERLIMSCLDVESIRDVQEYPLY